MNNINGGKIIAKKSKHQFFLKLFHPSNQNNNGKSIINSYFEQTAKEYIKYASGNFFSSAKYIEAKINNIPYKIPYEYGKIMLKTFGDNTDRAIIEIIIPNPYVFAINLFEILNNKLSIPAVVKNPAKYKTFSFIPKIKYNKALKRYENGA